MTPEKGETWSGRTVAVVVLALTLAAGVPRLVNLGELSFYGDEETTALVARSVAQGEGATMPSGMTYRRALPLTWLNAASARLFGLDDEISYRLPAALFGTLTVPLLFLFGRRFLGESVALVAATLLAFSEWHLVFSRMARMYAPFLFFFLVATWGVWRWAQRDDLRSLTLAAISLAAAATLHTFALFAAAFALIPIGLSRSFRTDGWKLLAFAGLTGGGIWFGLTKLLFPGLGERPPAQSGSATSESWQLAAIGGGWETWLIVLAGALVGGWAGLRTLAAEPDDGRAPIRSAGMVITLAAAGASACAGLLYGAALFGLFFLLVYRGTVRTFLVNAWSQFGAVTAVACLQVTLDMIAVGPVEGVKEALLFPFPYLGFLALEFPALTAVFTLVAAGLALGWNRDDRSHDGLRAVVLATLVPLLAMGLAIQWSAMRYLLPAYPFLLLASAAGLVAGAEWLTDRLGVKGQKGQPRLAVGILLAVVLVGGVRHHGLAASLSVATLEHGEPVDADLHQQPFRPDHEAAGEFLRSRTSENAVVIAEDPLEQHWYAGGVDYWLRRYGDARKFLYIAESNRVRDMYVNSIHARTPALLDSLVAEADGSVWLVTSGETAHYREYYLDEPQRRWVDSVESSRRPTYVARDSATLVYCLNC